MKYKQAKEKQYGIHNFDRKSLPINYVTMKNLQEYVSPPKEYIEKMKHLNDQEFKKEDKERIFLYGEFIKRKFYIDCLFKTKYSKRSIKYIKKSFSSDQECFNYISDIFILEEDRLNFYLRSKNCKQAFINSFKKNDYNIYNIIKNNFSDNLEVLKKLISSPDTYCKHKWLTDDDIESLKKFSNKSNYIYERILYGINSPQPFRAKTIEYQFNEFANTLRILNNFFSSYFDNCFLMLYRYIIDKYSLYMSDLFKINDMSNIISNEYKFSDQSHFFFLPNEIDESEFIKENVNICTDEKNSKISIQIKLIDNIDSLRIANYINQTLLNTLYYYKENHGLKYSDDEISYFIGKFDSSERHNKNNFTSRINGLYIWDKKHVESNKISITSICINFNKKYSNREDKKIEIDNDIIYLRRCFNAILYSIETLSFYPIK